jgi:hypothetical protein
MTRGHVHLRKRIAVCVSVRHCRPRQNLSVFFNNDLRVIGHVNSSSLVRHLQILLTNGVKA